MLNNQSEKINAKTRIKSSLQSLSDSERKVANWVLENSEEVLRLSMSQVAMECDVSDTTVLRMCRNAGFIGYSDMKLSLAQDSSNPTQIILEDIKVGDNSGLIIQKVFTSNIQALYDTLELINTEAMERAIQMISQAAHIQIIGIGGSQVVAQSLYQRLYRMGINCDSPQDIHLQIMHASLLNSSDLLIAISYSGRTNDVKLVLNQAKKNGVPSILITGNAKSKAASLASLVLLSVSHEIRSEPFAARLAQLSIVDSLSILYSVFNMEKTIETEKRIENALISKT